MKTDLYVKSIFGATLLLVLGSLSLMILGLPLGQNFNVWSVIANYLIAVTIGYVIVSSSYQSLKMSIIVFAIHFLIGNFSILIEAYIFNLTDRVETVNNILLGLLVSAIFSPVYVYFFRYKENVELPKFVSRTYICWAWRVILGNVIYLIVYFIAGMTLIFVYPELMDFYEGKLPSPEVVLKTQLLLRGFVFVAVAILMLRTLSASLMKKAILIGLVFSILGGIAPLIQPNELLPGYIRFGHLFEVGISNFLYGMVLGFLLGQKEQE